MIDAGYVRTMARYNAWQNTSLLKAAATLDEAARRQDRGAFFKSIHGTLCHLLWADRMWLSRFAGTPKPTLRIHESADLVADWADLVAQRQAFDDTILEWARDVSPEWLAGDLVWFSGATQREMRKPRALLVAHLFNHQTHHRGQIHAMLTAAGARPDDTDLMLLEPEV
ncbi:MAG: DinB family protein [Bosea sp. (in: a-proteobacteria)]|uniref:DinB family protein n=1 Tax=Bosea sp. (in: a-proteobacteria) TaxID=1871050 RepID=UPI0027377584|nr:DinB family protein [Bosea sp. (in: a-proteobacteria)]MDP3258772.1 DinB family protein [Bosea sp. (in: a-proteobacteria)]MDP3317897.1 DinB family protein [Bosea sp. (in: a-proteobacteria)]